MKYITFNASIWKTGNSYVITVPANWLRTSDLIEGEYYEVKIKKGDETESNTSIRQEVGDKSAVSEKDRIHKDSGNDTVAGIRHSQRRSVAASSALFLKGEGK